LNITILVEVAGKKLIRVVDDGCGMNEVDAMMCFEHHATSKINTIEDLNNLATFGFRGEALSSISSVSKINLITREKNQEQGISIELEDSKVINKNYVSCSTGTDISVKDLFYNVPARLKFLKKNETEWRQIVNLFQSFCLSNKNINFKLFHNNKLIYNCPAIEIKNRLVQLWDYNFAQNMIEIKSNQILEKASISGFISNHQFFRYNRSQIFFFVNGRWVKNLNLMKSFQKGYLNVLPQDRFPAGFIFINIHPDQIDVNIHPRKEEVQFLQAKKIEQSIQTLVKSNLEQSLSNKLNESLNVNINHIDFKPAFQTNFDYENIPSFDPIDSFVTDINNAVYNLKPKNSLIVNSLSYSSDNKEMVEVSNNDKTILEIQEKLEKKDYDLIGQFNKTYILIEKQEGLFIVDQHAAHERVLYELFSKRFQDVATTRLIFPQTINLTVESLDLLEQYLELLHNNGIDAQRLSKEQLVIQSTPTYLKDISLQNLIIKLVDWIEEYQILDRNQLFKTINEKLHAQMACKAAVKAGDKLSHEQIHKLLQDLNNVENRFACPHGRPTSWLLPILDIEKKFKRKL